MRILENASYPSGDACGYTNTQDAPPESTQSRRKSGLRLGSSPWVSQGITAQIIPSLGSSCIPITAKTIIQGGETFTSQYWIGAVHSIGQISNGPKSLKALVDTDHS